MLSHLLLTITFALSLLTVTNANAKDSIEQLITQIDPIMLVIKQHEENSKTVIVKDPKTKVVPVATRKSVYGKASYYGRNHHGRKTASGQRFNMWAMTAAHKTLPFGTCLSVHNAKTEQSVIVRITDRGPYHGNRILDLSQGAAAKIGMIKSGVASIEYQQVSCNA